MAGFSLIKIFFDTNLLHTSQAHLLLPERLREYVAENRAIESVALQWMLPRTVVEERRHQMFEAAQELMPKLAEFEKLLGHGLGFNDEIIADRIASKIDRAIEDLDIKICELDCSDIDWPALVDRSVRRKPPFEITGEKEKGFRDSLIASAFLQEVDRSPSTPRACLLVFVSGDDRLRDYLKEMTSDRGNIRLLESLDDLKSLLNAIASEITEEFLAEISPIAERTFYDFEKKGGLYTKAKVFELIAEDFGDTLAEVAGQFPLARREGADVTLGDQTFISKQGQTVVWSREVRLKFNIVQPQGALAQLLAQTQTPGSLGEQKTVASGLSRFDVEWQHQITTRGNVSRAKINGVEFVAHEFETEA